MSIMLFYEVGKFYTKTYFTCSLHAHTSANLKLAPSALYMYKRVYCIFPLCCMGALSQHTYRPSPFARDSHHSSFHVLCSLYAQHAALPTLYRFITFKKKYLSSHWYHCVISKKLHLNYLDDSFFRMLFLCY